MKKLARLGLAIILSLVLVGLISPAVQAEEETGSADLSATVPLTISDVSASSIGYYGATISWKTNGDATSQVFYDTVSHDNITDYRYYTGLNISLVSVHNIPLSGLSSGTTYHYRVRSRIGTDFVAISDDYTFKTYPPPPPPPTMETNLFGTTGSFSISSTGIIQETLKATSADGKLQITIPKLTKALDKYGDPLYTLVAAVKPSPPAPPEKAHIIGLAYDFGRDGATFAPPITFTWTYDPAALPVGLAEEDLVIAYYDAAAGKWVELDCVVDTEKNTITASVSHFTTFAIIGMVPVVAPPGPAAFSVTNLSVKPLEVQPEEVVTITVSVANTGGTRGSYTVVLKLNGVKEAEKTATIAAGSSLDVSFGVTREEVGDYTVGVDGLSGSFTVVAVPAPAAFSLSNLTVKPLEVQPEEVVTITVSVANTGGTEGSYTIVLKLNGVKEAEKTATIAAGSSLDVSFGVTREEAGDYNVAVDGLSGSFSVVALPSGVNWPLIGGIIAAAVVVAGLLIYFLVVRRRAA